MLKLLLKNNEMEIFKSFFYNSRKNAARPKSQTIALVVLCILFMVSIVAVFAYVCTLVCRKFVGAEMGWLYFVAVSILSISVGTLVSTFSTYFKLYLSKDNDLLLSLPVSVKDILVSRLLCVHLSGTLYSGVFIVPAVVIYWAVAGATPSNVVCGTILVFIITILVMVLSCVFGWIIAKVKLMLKGRKMAKIAMVVALLFLYLLVINMDVNSLFISMQSAASGVKNAFYPLYLFGKIGEGDLVATAIYVCVSVAFLAAVWIVISKTFMSIIVSSEKIKRAEYKIKQRGMLSAMLNKEFIRLSSSMTYMICCAFGVVFAPVIGISLLVNSSGIRSLLAVGSGFDRLLGSNLIFNMVYVLICMVLCFIACMIRTAAPSISLEGKTIWVLRSMPVSPKEVLRVKIAVQFLLTAFPMIFVSTCVAFVIEGSILETALIFILPLTFAIFMANFCMALGIKMPIMEWNNESIPIVRSLSAMASFFGGIAIIIGFVVIWSTTFITSTMTYLTIGCIVFAVAAMFLFRWIDTRGCQLFEEL